MRQGGARPRLGEPELALRAGRQSGRPALVAHCAGKPTFRARVGELLTPDLTSAARGRDLDALRMLDVEFQRQRRYWTGEKAVGVTMLFSCETRTSASATSFR